MKQKKFKRYRHFKELVNRSYSNTFNHLQNHIEILTEQVLINQEIIRHYEFVMTSHGIDYESLNFIREYGYEKEKKF